MVGRICRWVRCVSCGLETPWRGVSWSAQSIDLSLLRADFHVLNALPAPVTCTHANLAYFILHLGHTCAFAVPKHLWRFGQCYYLASSGTGAFEHEGNMKNAGEEGVWESLSYYLVARRNIKKEGQRFQRYSRTTCYRLPRLTFSRISVVVYRHFWTDAITKIPTTSLQNILR